MLLVPLMFFDWAEHLISRLKPEKGQEEKVPKGALIREREDVWMVF